MSKTYGSYGNLNMVAKDFVMMNTWGICLHNLVIVYAGFMPVLVILNMILLFCFVFRVARQVAYRSLFGREAAFYQSFPVSWGEHVTSKTITLGSFLAIGVLWVLLTVFGMMSRWIYGKHATMMFFPQLLVNLGYEASQAVSFTAVSAVAVFSGCLAAGGLILFAVVNGQTFERMKRIAAIAVYIAAGMIFMGAVNVLPYILLMKSLIAVPALIPLGILAVNVFMTAACGLKTVKLLENHYRIEG